MKKLLKNPRVIILIIALLLSILFIGPNPNPDGVKIDYIGKNSVVKGLSSGDIIYKIEGIEATPDLAQKDYFGGIKLDTSRGLKYVDANGSLGISVQKTPSSNLVFGLDITGGVRAVIEPNISDNTTIDRTISTLQTRINVYGLRECNFMPIWYEEKGFIEITMAGGSEDELKELLERQGMFRADIPVSAKLVDNESSITLDREYKIIVENDLIKIGEISANRGDTFILAGIPFLVSNISDVDVSLISTVYNENDIAIVYLGKSRIDSTGDGYRWSFPVEITEAGAQKFAWITQNVPIAPAKPGDSYRYLESKIYIYLDNELLDELNIRSGLKGKVETGISIEGWSGTTEQAKNSLIKLQSILKSGALPTSIQLVQLDSISPNLGSGFLAVAMTAGLAALMAVSVVIFLRYRKLKILLPVVFMSLAELLIILGVAGFIKWTIDLSAIAGIIASIGTGVDSEVVMIDQAMRGEKRTWTLKEKISHAFFIIFGSAGTLVAAMFPMMILGFGILRGFAITTSIGVLAGVFITRPVFGVIIEKLISE